MRTMFPQVVVLFAVSNFQHSFGEVQASFSSQHDAEIPEPRNESHDHANIAEECCPP